MSPPEPENTSPTTTADHSEKNEKKNRRAHRKSRTGCQRCKERRVKCNEEKPTCFNCKRHGASCVYGDAAAFHHGNGGFHPIPGTPTYGSYTSGIAFEMKDMALLHHWSTSCAATMSTAPWMSQIWQVAIPKIGFQHPYLMHAILAVSALHIAYLAPANRRDLTIDAATHYHEAIMGFREVIAVINEQNCDAMFATSVINMFYVFAITGRDDDVSEPNLTKELEVLDAKWIHMVRGCGAILVPAFDFVSRGPLSPLLEIGDWNTLDPDQDPSEHDGRLLALKEIWGNEQTDQERNAAYDQTLHRLRQTLHWMDHEAVSGSRISWAGPFIWLHVIPGAYLELLWQRQPPALVLFAYFGALVHRLDGFWWAKGWGRKIVGAVDKFLGSYWRSRIEWPLEIVGLCEDAT
ncbi:hypothetical protein F5Y06DRAFT_276801 [Hypoxylon sp. FL0890]|nr:hypothetical protein F5Y06DRAFT_276801 [Hypoxylon sp. FL0890]